LSNSAYVTSGPGSGAGFIVDGKLLHGSIHPEFGHLKLPRLAGDDFSGICPYHADCLEGMASGPAIQQRWSMSAADLPESHAAWKTEAWYLAHGILAMLAIVSPERVILGGGVSQASHLHSLTEKCLNEVAGAYFPEINSKPYVVAPKLGQQAGIIGSIMLAGHG
ncbi:MAG: ROK family protein, partial [Luteolibacter sp.]